MGLYLGIDLGTQSMKGIIIDPGKGSFTAPVSVHYGDELPQYGSPGGFLAGGDPAVRHADPRMWLDALDLLLAKMHRAGLPMEQICGVSGSGQQHGTVYLNSRFYGSLASLKPESGLAEQLADSFSRKSAPIWMDSSTGYHCALLRKRFGSTIKKITGSDAAERFSGPQIMKFALEQPQAWQETSRVHLVSSFMASVLTGKSSPIDYGDGAGMNLLDLNTLKWSSGIADFTAPDLCEKLPPCVASNEIAGTLAPYFAKYGLCPGIPVNVWSGDNPNSLIGCGCIDSRSAMISLGTSDTFSGIVNDFADAPRENGHIFGCPAGGFMSLICFTNGSLTRDHFRKKYGLSFSGFDRAASEAEPAKFQLLPFLTAESTPAVADPAIHCNFDMSRVTSGEMIRALLESQILTMRHHAGLVTPPAAIRLTGGASASVLLRRIIADVFQVPVLLGSSAETAALGAAMRAANCTGEADFGELTEKFCRVESVIDPDPGAAQKYDIALERFAELLRSRGYA